MASPATQDVCARPKAAAHTGCGGDKPLLKSLRDSVPLCETTILTLAGYYWPSQKSLDT